MDSLVSRSWTTLTFGTVVFAISVLGCNGCEMPGYSPSPPAVDDLEGEWVVSSYALDEDGCQPADATAPFELITVDLVEAEDDRSASVRLRICSSSDNCPQQAAPENELSWNGEYHRGEAAHYSGDIVEAAPQQRRCRLSAVKTLLAPVNSHLELTRSHFELVLPLEGDETCTPELAEAYGAQLPCTRAETARLAPPESGASPTGL